jgi:hypothetical protein
MILEKNPSEDEYLEWIGRIKSAGPKPAPINTGSDEAIDPRRAKTIDSRLPIESVKLFIASDMSALPK